MVESSAFFCSRRIVGRARRLFSGGSEGPLLSWLATYAVHSTLILGATWLLFARSSLGSLRLREAIWKTALLGGLVTASLQMAWQVDPLAGRWILPSPSGGSVAALDGVDADLAFGGSFDISNRKPVPRSFL